MTGVTSLHASEYSIIPDQIEAGTFMVAAAATRGDVLIKNVIPKHLEAISVKLMKLVLLLRNLMTLSVLQVIITFRTHPDKDTTLSGISYRYAATDRNIIGFVRWNKHCN